MTEGINISGFSCITAAAVTGFHALFGASWCGSYCPFAEAMAEGIFIICNITIAAGACICGVALCGAGGGCHSSSVMMICWCDISYFKRIAASAGSGFRTLFSASRCLGLLPCAEIVAEGGNFRHSAHYFAAARAAGSGCMSCFGAGGCFCFCISFGMSERLHEFVLVRISANRAFMQLVAAYKARRLNRRYYIAVLQQLVIMIFFLFCSALAALKQVVAMFRASGRNCL